MGRPAYDALHRLLHAKDDDPIVNRTCDSLSRVLTEVHEPRSVVGAEGGRRRTWA
ncbi:MAG: hypothetical protein K8T90_08610 [Planctomycetes bacterium]|nr:hypothetical protein [Planctomycetota bacterium]